MTADVTAARHLDRLIDAYRPALTPGKFAQRLARQARALDATPADLVAAGIVDLALDLAAAERALAVMSRSGAKLSGTRASRDAVSIALALENLSELRAVASSLGCADRLDATARRLTAARALVLKVAAAHQLQVAGVDDDVIRLGNDYAAMMLRLRDLNRRTRDRVNQTAADALLRLSRAVAKHAGPMRRDHRHHTIPAVAPSLVTTLTSSPNAPPSVVCAAA